MWPNGPIPASAGETPIGAERLSKDGAYPRECGGNYCILFLSDRPEGLSCVRAIKIDQIATIVRAID